MKQNVSKEPTKTFEEGGIAIRRGEFADAPIKHLGVFKCECCSTKYKPNKERIVERGDIVEQDMI